MRYRHVLHRISNNRPQGLETVSSQRKVARTQMEWKAILIRLSCGEYAFNYFRCKKKHNIIGVTTILAMLAAAGPIGLVLDQSAADQVVLLRGSYHSPLHFRL